MSSFDTQHINVPVFAGQGTNAVNSPSTRERALRDASSSNGSLLLAACHEAFHNELATLSSTEVAASGIDPSDFEKPQSLLHLPREQYSTNPIITGTTLTMIQTLRYLALIESYASPSTSFITSLAQNVLYSLGVMGFSSGVIAACVVGTSGSSLEYIAHAVEAFRLSFWIGIRSQEYRLSAVGPVGPLDDESPRPWSLVFLGMGRQAALDAIKVFASAVSDCASMSG